VLPSLSPILLRSADVPADGMCLVLHSAPEGLTALGGPGGGMGDYRILKSLALCLDLCAYSLGCISGPARAESRPAQERSRGWAS